MKKLNLKASSIIILLVAPNLSDNCNQEWTFKRTLTHKSGFVKEFFCEPDSIQLDSKTSFSRLNLKRLITDSLRDAKKTFQLGQFNFDFARSSVVQGAGVIDSLYKVYWFKENSAYKAFNNFFIFSTHFGVLYKYYNITGKENEFRRLIYFTDNEGSRYDVNSYTISLMKNREIFSNTDSILNLIIKKHP